MRVGVQGQLHITVPQPLLDNRWMDVLRKQVCSVVVPQIVEADFRQDAGPYHFFEMPNQISGGKGRPVSGGEYEPLLTILSLAVLL